MVAKEFEVHMLNDLGKDRVQEMAVKFSDLLTWVKSIGEPGREQALVATKLEAACFFAKKSLAIKKENQQ